MIAVKAFVVKGYFMLAKVGLKVIHFNALLTIAIMVLYNINKQSIVKTIFLFGMFWAFILILL